MEFCDVEMYEPIENEPWYKEEGWDIILGERVLSVGEIDPEDNIPY